MNLNWIYIAISWVLLRWHDLWAALLGARSGFAWVLAIVFLVITARTLLFPVFVKQIKSQRAMQTLQPQVKALQEKHKGDRETLQREMMELYRREKANPAMGCLPIVLQIPVFLGLFHVLRLIDPSQNAKAIAGATAMVKEYFWKQDEFRAASNARLFGAPIAAQLRDTPERLHALGLTGPGTVVKVVAGILILTMVATTYITQRQMIARTGPPADPQQRMVQKLMLYGVPVSLLVSGTLFPIGVVIYWVTTNLFSMGQQFYVLRKMPPPGTKPAASKDAQDTKVVIAPRPGVKPVNTKKGGRPAVPSVASPADPSATVIDTPGSTGNGRPNAAGSRKRKGGRR